MEATGRAEWEVYSRSLHLSLAVVLGFQRSGSACSSIKSLLAPTLVGRVPITLELRIPHACSWLSVLRSHPDIPFPFWAVNWLVQGWHGSRRGTQCSHPHQEP